MAQPAVRCVCGRTLKGDELCFAPSRCLCDQRFRRSIPDWFYYVRIRGYCSEEERRNNPSLPEYFEHLDSIHVEFYRANEAASSRTQGKATYARESRPSYRPVGGSGVSLFSEAGGRAKD